MAHHAEFFLMTAFRVGLKKLRASGARARTSPNSMIAQGASMRAWEHRAAGCPSAQIPNDEMEDEFVAALAEHLSERAADNAFDALIVAASPRALGAFRTLAAKALSDKVIREVHGDYAKGDPDLLLAALQR